MSEIPEPKYVPYTGMFGCGINYPCCKEDCYWYREEIDMGAHVPCCTCKNKFSIEPDDCKDCEQYHRVRKETMMYDELIKRLDSCGRAGRVMEKLEPCPFCGGKGHYRFKRAIYYGINAYGEAKLRVRSYVQCGSCKARGAVYGTTLITESSGKIKDSDIEFIKERLTEAWNQRKISFKTVSELYRFPSCLIRDTANENEDGE